jgi:exosortase
MAIGIQRRLADGLMSRGIEALLPRQFLLVMGTIVAGAIVYLPTTASLAHMWNAFGSRFYTHGDLIVLMAAIGLFNRREALSRTPIARSWIGTALLLPLTLGWVLLYQSTIQVTHQVLLPLILLDLVYALFGLGIARVCLYPMAFLYFAIPVWERIINPLQRLTVAAMEVVLPLAGVPTLIVGNTVHIPAGSFEIESGCAGEMYLILALAMAVFYGDQLRASTRARAALIVTAGVLAIFGNWVRVFGVIIAGQLTNMQSYLVRVSHDEFGWAIFGAAMLAFVLLANRFVIARRETHEREGSGPAQTHGTKRRTLVVVAAAVACLGPAWRALAPNQALAAAAPFTQPGPARNWLGPLPYDGPWRPRFVGADRETIVRYRNAQGDEALVYGALYIHESQEVKLHRIGNSLLNEDMVQVGDSRKVTDSPFVELQIQTGSGESGILWATYRAGNRLMSSPLRAQLWYSIYSLTRPAPIGVTALQTVCQPDCAAARQRLQGFVSASPWLQ